MKEDLHLWEIKLFGEKLVLLNIVMKSGVYAHVSTVKQCILYISYQPPANICILTMKARCFISI